MTDERRTHTWRELISQEMEQAGESWADVESVALPPGGDLDKPFDAGFGSTDGVPFTIWTARRVYFPFAYDGAESCASISRHPDGNPTQHIGG